MTSEGSAWPRLRRALDHGNLVEALTAASELEHVGLAEALELLLRLPFVADIGAYAAGLPAAASCGKGGPCVSAATTQGPLRG